MDLDTYMIFSPVVNIDKPALNRHSLIQQGEITCEYGAYTKKSECAVLPVELYRPSLSREQSGLDVRWHSSYLES